MSPSLPSFAHIAKVLDRVIPQSANVVVLLHGTSRRGNVVVTEKCSSISPKQNMNSYNVCQKYYIVQKIQQNTVKPVHIVTKQSVLIIKMSCFQD